MMRGTKEDGMPPRDPGPVLAVGARRAERKRGAAKAAVNLPFDVVESKLHVPVLRPGVVSRTALVNRLRVTTDCPVVAVTAPAGYGKTTLLAQWAARDKRAFAWVSIDERDNDPVVLLRHLAAAIHQVEALDARVLNALRSPGKSMWAAAIPRLGSALASRERPLVLVLDDAHLASFARLAGRGFRTRRSHARGLPARPGRPRSTASADRRTAYERPTPRARRRRARAVGREARLLLSNAGADLADDDVEELVTRTEGWAAGLYLAALSLRERRRHEDGTRPEIVPFAGDDRYLADYFRAEYLSRLSPEHLTFLRRTSVLGKMSGPLCDRVLERKESTAELASIERSNLFLVPLDRHREWYRYHHLFHDLLARELTETEPELVPELHRRAADWYEENGDPESGLEHADASGDKARVARLVASLAPPAYESGRIKTVEAWLDRFGDEAELERYPAVAVIGGWMHALQGQAADAERWLDIAMRGADNGALPDGSTSARPWIALLRAAMCEDGVEQMLNDAEGALAELPPGSRWRPTALLLQGVAYVLLGDDERGDAILAQAAEAAESFGATDTLAVAISERSLIAAARDDPTAAEKLSVRARELVEEGQLDGYVTSSIELAATARALLRHGRWDQARLCLTAARRLTPSSTTRFPGSRSRHDSSLRGRTWPCAIDRERAPCCRRSGRSFAIARCWASSREQTEAIQNEVDGMPEAANGNGTGLTGAELRLLPLLATHFSFREIGEQLHVSRNTVKTQAISVYRKLGVSNRSDAIERAGRLGLIDAAPRP